MCRHEQLEFQKEVRGDIYEPPAAAGWECRDCGEWFDSEYDAEEDALRQEAEEQEDES